MSATACPAATPVLRAFVQDTLGCTCPESVFESVEHGSLSDVAGESVTRLVIGGRLLIYIAAGETTAARVSALAGFGRRDRDTNGLNRFRLVVGMPAEASDVTILETAFRDTVGDDPQVHLHCVAAAVCDAVLTDG